MSYRVIYEQHCREINGLVDILGKYVNSYRLMIGSAGELNSIALAKKSDVKDTLKRVEDIGELIDCITKTLDCMQCNYVEYLRIRNSLIAVELSKDIILTEIDMELGFINDKRDINENAQTENEEDKKSEENNEVVGENENEKEENNSE